MPMNADIMPLEIALVFLIELLFGLGYNALVAYAFKHRLMHVSLSVVIGVALTLVIPALFWFDRSMPFWEAGLLLLVCFAGSGVPMIIGSTRRTVKDKKKRRPLGNAALRIRDEVVMDLSTLAYEIADKAKANELTVRDLPDYVNRLHCVIGTLKSV